MVITAGQRVAIARSFFLVWVSERRAQGRRSDRAGQRDLKAESRFEALLVDRPLTPGLVARAGVDGRPD